MPFRDNTVEFSYNPEAARAVQCRTVTSGSFGTQSSPYPHGPGVVPLNISLTYRTPPAPNYGYQNKSECYMSHYAPEYSDENLDYSLSGASYPLLGQEHVVMSPAYSSHTSARGWSNSSGQDMAPKSANDQMYFAQENSSSYPGVQYHPHSFAMRQSIGGDSNNFSFSHMASSLPTASSVTSSDRVLPMPSNNRSNSMANSALSTLARSADGLPYSGHIMKSGNSMMTNGSQSMAYLPLSSSPSEPILSCNTGGHSIVGHEQQDMYSPSNDSWAPPGHIQNETTLRSQDSSSELYYTAGSGTSRKVSQSEQSSVSGTLSNGQVYLPYSGQEHSISRHPSMDMVQVATHQSSNTSLRAA
jgi:hypothetical protein